MNRNLLMTGLTAAVLIPSLARAQDTPARAVPGPLPTPAFEVPASAHFTLSNGLGVRIVENHEVPLWSVRLVIKAGSGLDPAGQAGLASVTLDLLDDGTTTRSSDEIARTLKQLGSSLHAGATLDASSVGASGIVRNLAPTLDVLADVVTAPTFPDDEWAIVQRKRIADAQAKLDDPTVVGREAFYRVLFGDAYQGAASTPASYGAITTQDMRDWHHRTFSPENAVLLVGGDVTPETVLPLLEARFGTWAAGTEGPVTPATGTSHMPEHSTLYFIDKPGAAQSVIRVGGFVGTRADDDYYAFHMANMVLGGAFTARLNLNLREDKGYTYGARCSHWSPRGPGVWFCSSSVRTDATGASLTEFNRELTDIVGDRPVSDDELAYFTSNEVNGYPTAFEGVGHLLGEEETIWIHDLPEDWVSRYLPGVQAVTTDAANAAMARHVNNDHLVWTVVGDRAEVWDDLQAFGLPVVELNRDGSPKEAQ